MEQGKQHGAGWVGGGAGYGGGWRRIEREAKWCTAVLRLHLQPSPREALSNGRATAPALQRLLGGRGDSPRSHLET